MMNDNELDALIDDCLEGRLTEANAAKLGVLIRNSPEIRARYWELAAVHGLLEHTLQQASLRVITGEAGRESGPIVQRFRRRWLERAACLLIGIFIAPTLWAYAMPAAARPSERTTAVLAEGFEDPDAVPGRGFPTEANRWSGNLAGPVGAVGDVTPPEGNRMMRLLPAPKRKFGYAWRIVDLTEHPEAANAESLRLEVAASFAASDPARPTRYQIRLAAFAEEPAKIRAMWNDAPNFFDVVLQHVGRNVLTEPGRPGRRTVHAALHIPPGTRSVVISLAAGAEDPAPPPAEYFLDDVKARFVITQPPTD